MGEGLSEIYMNWFCLCIFNIMLFQSPYNQIEFDRTGEGSATTYFDISPSSGAVFLIAPVSSIADKQFYVSIL